MPKFVKKDQPTITTNHPATQVELLASGYTKLPDETTDHDPKTAATSPDKPADDDPAAKPVQEGPTTSAGRGAKKPSK